MWGFQYYRIVPEGHNANKEHMQVSARQTYIASPHVWPLGIHCQLPSEAQGESLSLKGLSPLSMFALWTSKGKVH